MEIKNQSVINRIDQLRVESDDILLERQRSHIPCIYNILLEQKEGYYFKNNYYKLEDLPVAQRKKYRIYLSKNIPFSFTNEPEVYIDTLINLISKDKIVPFMIFANGIFIKWSNITIVKDKNYSYIILSGLDDIEDLDNIHFECILLPCAIRYGENQNIIEVQNESMRFYFNVDGYLTDQVDDINVRIEIIDPAVSGYVYSEFSNNLIKLNTDKHGQITSKDNIIFRKNDIIDFIKIDDVTEVGHNYFKCESLTGYKIYSYIYNKLESSNSIHYNIGDAEVVDSIIYNNIINNESSSTLDLISNNFNFTYDRSKSFQTNIKDSLDYITGYDSRLLDPIYKKNLKIVTKHYSGSELLAMKNDDGLVYMPRRTTNKIYDNHIMIFVNDYLYRFHSRIKYTHNMVTFPLVNISDEDNIEIIFFYGINNEIANFTVNDNEQDIYIDKRFDLSDCYLYCNQIEGELFPIESPDDGSQTKIDFTYTEVSDNVYNITLDNEFFYGKELGISNPNQFRYVHYNAIKDMVGFQLPKEFRYCREKDKYMIFIDGRKIDEEYFELVTDTFDTPIFDISIYTKIPLYKESYIDIFYLPYTFDKITADNESLNNKDIIIDDSKLSYRLNNYAYLYFVNGKKIAENEIINLTKNKVRLNIDPQSSLHFQIFRHVDPIECLTDLFIESDYDTYINTLSEEEIKAIFKSNIDALTNTEVDIYHETIDHRQLIFEIVKDYYMNVDLDIMYNEFIYEYDDAVISEEDKDVDNNYIIRLTDSSYYDKANLYHTDYIEGGNNNE